MKKYRKIKARGLRGARAIANYVTKTRRRGKKLVARTNTGIEFAIGDLADPKRNERLAKSLGIPTLKYGEQTLTPEMATATYPPRNVPRAGAQAQLDRLGDAVDELEKRLLFVLLPEPETAEPRTAHTEFAQRIEDLTCKLVELTARVDL